MSKLPLPAKTDVFFSDIADFTATTDSLESEELTGLLNHYLTEMSRIALDHGATVDKYIGDAVVAFFGDPETRGIVKRDNALACVNMAIEMQRRMRTLQSEWRDAGLEKPFQMRIGISTGFCTVGNFGSEDRMDYTIIGGPVNLAGTTFCQRAEPGRILLSHETFSLVKNIVQAEEQAPVQAKGFAEPVHNYRVVDHEDLPEQPRSRDCRREARGQDLPRSTSVGQVKHHRLAGGHACPTRRQASFVKCC